MRKLILILLCLPLSALMAFAQTTPESHSEDRPTIESVDITGVAESRITPTLQNVMQGLVGTKFDQVAADEVAFRIQNELSEHLSAVRELPGSEPDRIKLVFAIGDLDTTGEAHPNVNSRYTVEEVELQGAFESLLSAKLRDDMHKLAGAKLDQDRAEEIEKRIAKELGADKVVSRKVVKGSSRDQVRLIYEVENAPFLHFSGPGSYLIAHSKQSASLRLQIDVDEFGKRANNFYFGVANDAEPLIERYAGYFVGFENIKAGTDHIGFRVEYFNYRDQWKSATPLALKASPQIPGIYRERRGIEPTVTFALDRLFNVSAGVSVQELQMQDPSVHFLNTNAVFAAARFDDKWKDSGSHRQELSASYLLRASTRKLASDFVYIRHFAEVHYDIASRRNEFIATANAGVITGNAPLFERFTLGNASTLRGWNKYDLSPTGGSRLAYGSLEYRFTQLLVYYDAGAVWERGTAYKTSHAVGFGLHGRKNDHWFLTLGVPIRSGRIQPLKPVFMLGGHF